MTVGAIIAALGYSLFQVPYDIAAGGIGGIGIIANHFTGWPVGILYLMMNIPLLILGFFFWGTVAVCCPHRNHCAYFLHGYRPLYCLST